MMTSSTEEKEYEAVCRSCRRYLGYSNNKAAGAEENGAAVVSCPVCLGLWDCKDQLIEQFQEACEPYGGAASNFFSRTSPIILLPGDVTLRYNILYDKRRSSSWNKFQTSLKDHLKNVLTEFMDEKGLPRDKDAYDSVIHQEEQGYLSTQLCVTAPKDIARPSNFFRKQRRSNRKRFRGNDPTLKQAGNPLVNQQHRLTTQEGYTLWTVSELETAYAEASQSVRESLVIWFHEHHKQQAPVAATAAATVAVTNAAAELHVVVSRQPFFVRALYTKARRDVSQTPFYVPCKDGSTLASNGAAAVMKRLGITSVEEQIVPALTEACGGISTHNNNGDEDVIVYGMVKFHASGREDMNVRMTLPPGTTTNVGGRPFCCEVIDALRMPTAAQLKDAVHKVNCSEDVITTDPEDATRTYGTNPSGVGISGCLSFVPADSFKNLQADTEEKIKYYGCHCWSEAVIPSQEYLSDRLSRVTCPIVLKQRTPVRVLHRRPNTVRTRHVLTLEGTRIDDHYFRLSLSTDAGTYVKEFVHGDLGRTVPNVSKLLAAKTDILLLDCQGIQQG